MGRYLAAPWAPLAAARRPRRAMDGSDAIPGEGKGLRLCGSGLGESLVFGLT